MRDERILVQTEHLGALGTVYIKRSEIERAVLETVDEVLRRADQLAMSAPIELRLWTAIGLLRDKKPEERPQHNTLRGLPTQDRFREAVRELVEALEIRVPDPTPCLALCHFLPVGEFYWIQDELAKVKAMLEAEK